MVIVYYINDHLLFVGVDKFENEGLIKYSQKYSKELETPVYWFHVDDLSSPHAYVRLNEGETAIPNDLIQMCAQIVKDGSIEGVKRPAVDVIYTKCVNLVKNKSMKVGQVSFTPRSERLFLRGVRKDNQLLKQLEKAKGDRDLTDMERELDDMIKNKKKFDKKKKVVDEDDWGDDGDDDEPAPPPKKNNAQGMFDGMTKAEFSTNLEDDFM